MQLIGLAGQARTGKDTVGTYLVEQHEFVRYPMAGPLKNGLHSMLGLDPADFQTTEEKEAIIPWLGVSYRHCAQTLGTDWMRKLVNEDGWLLVARQCIAALEARGVPGVVITDVRFENEADMVRSLGGHVVHLRSKRALEGMTVEARAHVSESGVAVGPRDYVLINDGAFLDLFRGVETLRASFDAIELTATAAVSQ